jgi:23S rRNA (cytosine1962-C5)-methyltransferase
MSATGKAKRDHPEAADAPARSSVRPRLDVIETAGFPDYALLDSGAGRKLERFGKIVINRPEPQALWQPHLGKADWDKAHAVFSASGEDEEKGRWRFDKPVPESWPVKVGAATVLCRLQGLWHVGLFPEQFPHWEWMLQWLGGHRGEPPRVLNLFAYTGAASLLAAAAGAHVTHVDASKKAIGWAKENQAQSGLQQAHIRWILDDAQKFVAREVRRGKTYDLILVDPPKFGRGPDGEVWDLFQHLPPLLAGCAKLVAPGRSAMVLTVYAIRASALAFHQLLEDTLKARGGEIESGELAIRASQGAHAVPTSLYSRWCSDDVGR